jgi:hypothetical protein
MDTTAGERRLTVTERARDAAVTAGQRLMSAFEWWLLRSSEIPTTPFLDRAEFAWAGAIEDGWQDIRAELDGVLARHEDLPLCGCPHNGNYAEGAVMPSPVTGLLAWGAAAQESSA